MPRRYLFLSLLLLIVNAGNSQTAEEFYNKGVSLKDGKQPKEALAAFKAATSLDPDYTAAWYEMGWCSNDLKDYKGAIMYLRKALDKWSATPKVHFELGYALEKTNKYDSAQFHYKRCLELKPDYSLAHKQLGTVAYQKEDYVSALESFGKYELYAKNPISDYLYWYRKGFMMNAQKKYDEAIIALEKSKAIKSDYINTHLELGFASSRLKQNDAAIGHYKKAMELDPKSHIPYNGIGEVYRDNIKDRSESMKWYQKTLDIKPKERKACFGMGYCLNSLERYNEALPYFKTAIEQEDTYTAAYVEIGYSYYMTKNYTLGLENLKKAVSLNAANTNARYYLGLIYIAQANKTMAQKMVDELKVLGSKDAPALQEKVNKM
jgi:tetratricopeptide (TPR) repeat protein